MGATLFFTKSSYLAVNANLLFKISFKDKSFPVAIFFILLKVKRKGVCDLPLSIAVEEKFIP